MSHSFPLNIHSVDVHHINLIEPKINRTADTKVKIMMETTTMMSRSECLERLQGMLSREETVYSTSAVVEETSEDDYPSIRRSLIEVFEEVSDQYNLQNPDTTPVAISFMDRYMQSQPGFVNVQLVAATSLYLAIKMNEPIVMPPAMLCDVFSRCLDCDEEDDEEDFDAEDLQAFEFTLMKALNFKLNPPTAMTFVSHFLACLPTLKTASWVESAEEVARVQLEVAQRDNASTQFQASTLAVASLFTAVESFPAGSRVALYKFLLQAARMTAPDQQHTVLKAQDLLKRLVASASVSEMPTKKRVVEDESFSTPPTKKLRSEGSFVVSP